MVALNRCGSLDRFRHADPARAFPPRTPPGYLFSGDAEHAKAGGRYRVGTRWPPMVMTARVGFHSPRGPFSLWLACSGHCATVRKKLNRTERYTMRMNINQAAKAVGVARSTLYRDIQEGKVSVGKDGRGKPYVDVAELERAYGSVTLSDTSETVSIGQTGTPQKDKKDSALQREHDLLREQIELLRSERDDLRRRLDDETEERRAAQAKLTALLTDQRATASQKAVAGRWARAWGILRGKA